MLRSRAEAIAQNFKIPMEDLRRYAAFHNETHHPHVHLIVYSSAHATPYLTQKGVMNLRSSLAKDIFAQDLLCVYEIQTKHRDALWQESRAVISKIVLQINNGTYENPVPEARLIGLARWLMKAGAWAQTGIEIPPADSVRRRCDYAGIVAFLAFR